MNSLTRAISVLVGFVSVMSAQANSEKVTGETSTTLTIENKRIDDRFNVRITEPHSLLFSDINIEALVRIGSHFAVGPTFGYMHEDDAIHVAGTTYDYLVFEDKNIRYQLGVKGVYYFNHVNSSGAYITTFARYAHTEVTRKTEPAYSSLLTDRKGSTQFDEFIYGMTSGYQWQVGRIRLSIGGGYQLFNAPDKIIISYQNSTDIATVEDTSRSGSAFVDGGIGMTF